LSFQSGQIDGGMFAEAELLSAAFLSLLQLRLQITPLEIISGPKILSREELPSTGHSRNDAH
jgi:hypothetical protein